MAAGLALLKHTDLTAKEIALEALGITAGICIYTNDNISVVELTGKA
jgi:ATP-dependent HslUV protease subunit HslV